MSTSAARNSGRSSGGLPLATSEDGEAERVRDEERELARLGLVARVKARMDLLGLNPYSAAKKAGLGGDYVRDIMRGRVQNPSTERLGKLAEALECSLRYLLGQDEVELKRTTRSGWDSEPVEVPSPPAPLPLWHPQEGKPYPQLLPIKFELMADAFRRVTDVVRPPLGYEAATIPLPYADRPSWWEVIRDDSVARVAPPGSLVQVVEMADDERDQIGHGEFVIVVKRMVGPDAAYNLVERSMRRVVYRYPDLGLWFLEYARPDPDEDLSDEVWRSGEPTAPRKSLDQVALEIDDPDERAAALAQNAMLREAIQRQKSGPPSPKTQAALDRMNDPAWQAEAMEMLEQRRKWRPQLVGKVVRVLSPLDPRAGFFAD